MQTVPDGAVETAITRLPTDPRDLSPEFLSGLISRTHPGTRVESVELLESMGVGGMVSTAGRAKLRLRYAGSAQDLPERVQVKMIVGEKSGVPPCLYETEVRMYQRMLPGLPIERAMCLGAEYEADTENFVLLLEDLTLRGAIFSNVLQPAFSPAEVGVLLDQLATLHAHYWKSPALESQSDWLSSHTAGKQFSIFHSGRIVRILETNVIGSTYRQDFVERTGHSPAELWDLVKAVQRHQAATLPLTLCHGDTGAHNSYRLSGGGAGYVDWQLSVKGAWAHDVHYLLCTALSVKDRRVHEKALIARYLKQLSDLGVPYQPTIDEAMDAYSLAMIWGLVIGWFTVPNRMYGIEIITANIERLFAAVCDHNVIQRAEALL